MKYTAEQVANFSYSQMCEVKSLSELPDKMVENLKAKMTSDAGLFINTGVEIHLVSENGRREFYAKRHSDRRTGWSVWSVCYCKRGYGVVKDVIGYGFDIVKTRFGRTADGTEIPKEVSRKQDVLDIIEHIEWAKEMIKK